MYESIDPRGFKNIIVYKLLKDYKNYIKHSYKSFEPSIAKIERQQFSFIFDLYLINFPFEPRTELNDPIEMFELLRKFTGKKKMSIGMNVIADENQISCIKVPRIINPKQTLLKFLNDKDYTFVSLKKFKPLNNKIDLQLKFRRVYPVTDRKNSILNSAENFIKTNDLIKYFLSRYDILTINELKANKAISEIEESIKNSSDENFLLTF